MNTVKEQPIANSVNSLELQRHDKTIKSVLLAIATILTTLGLVAAGYLLYRVIGMPSTSYALNPQTSQNTLAANPSTQALASSLTTTRVDTQPTSSVQSALANKAQVELLAVKRIPGVADEVTIELRMTRLANNGITKIDTIDPRTTTARDPLTSETYKAVDPQHRASKPVALLSVPQNQPVDGYVVLKVPANLNTIDIFVEKTATFRNVAIANN